MRLVYTSKKMGIGISAEKSKLLVVGETTERIDEIVQVGGRSLEHMQQFKQLRYTIHENGKSTAEAHTRVDMAKEAMSKLPTICMSKQITFLLKLRLLRYVVISRLLYGCKA